MYIFAVSQTQTNTMESDEQQDFERKSETRGFRVRRRANVVLRVSDIRNKLTPIKNLIAMIENDNLGDPRITEMVQSEIAEAKKSIEYLSQHEYK